MTAPDLSSYAISRFGWTVVAGNIWLGLVIGLVVRWSRDP